MTCLAPNGKPLCDNGLQRRWSGDRWEDVPCCLCQPERWAAWAKEWKVPAKPEKPVEKS